MPTTSDPPSLDIPAGFYPKRFSTRVGVVPRPVIEPEDVCRVVLPNGAILDLRMETDRLVVSGNIARLVVYPEVSNVVAIGVTR